MVEPLYKLLLITNQTRRVDKRQHVYNTAKTQLNYLFRFRGVKIRDRKKLDMLTDV